MGGHGEEHPGHGTRPGHVGHTSGVHQPTEDSHESAPGRGPLFRARGGYGYQDTYFGGGPRLGGLEAVPEGVGGFGYSFGPGPAYHSRYRYWGGRAIPPPEEQDDDSSYIVYVPAGSGGGGAYEQQLPFDEGRCDDVDPDSPAPFSQRNAMRLSAAHEVLAPDLDPRRVREREAAVFALAIYQHEMLSTEPDLLFAGSYLGSVAREVVTQSVVEHVNFHLCVGTTDESNAQVAAVADGQRDKLVALARNQ